MAMASFGSFLSPFWPSASASRLSWPASRYWHCLTFHPSGLPLQPGVRLADRSAAGTGPDGPPGFGIFDRLGDGRRLVGTCVSLAAALSIAQVPLFGQPVEVGVATRPAARPESLEILNTVPVSYTTAALAFVWWLIAIATIIISYARRPAGGTPVDVSTASASDASTLAAAS